MYSCTNCRGPNTSIPRYPEARCSPRSPLTITRAPPAIAQARNLSSARSAHTGAGRSAASTNFARADSNSRNGPASTPGNSRLNRRATTQYSCSIDSDTTISTRPLRHASSTRYGQPPKNTPDINTFVSTTALNPAPASHAPPAQRPTSSSLRVWRRVVPMLSSRRTRSSTAA